MSEALADAELATSILRELDLPRGELVGLNVTSDVLGELWQLDRLVENAEKALRTSDAFGGRFHRPEALAGMGWRSLVVWGIWGGYASALAASLDERWADASELGRAVLEEAGSCSEMRAEWRAAAVAARSLRILGRVDEAERCRIRGAAILRPVLDSVPDELRSVFAAKPAAAELLRVP